MTTVRSARAGAAVRAVAVAGAAVLLGLAWTTAPDRLGPYALADGALNLNNPATAPSGLVAEPHDRSLTLSWNTTTATGSPITRYAVLVGNVEVKTVDAPQPSTARASTTLTGLTNYRNYAVSVVARDSVNRDSPPSPQATTTPFDDVPPSPVTGLVAARGDGRVTLTWEPESSAESDRAGVRVYVDGSLRTSLPAVTTRYEVTGLSNDVEHTFYLVASDARPTGYGPPGSVAPNASQPSATVRATPTDLTPPSPPTAFTAVRGDTTAALGWTAPPEGDVGLYEVVDETGALIASFAAPATSGTATALTNGRAHRLRLVAVDTHGNHSPASAETTVTPATPPVARTGLVATRGDGQVALAWAARVSDPAHAAAVQLRVSVDGALVATLPGTATSYLATGLTDDRRYAFSVVGVDDQGRPGPAATVGATPTDLTPPSAPTTFAAARQDAGADLTWTAPPEGDVGLYEVVDQGGTPLVSASAPLTSTTAGGLTNGSTYRLRLVAVDTHGNRSAPSGEVSVTPTAPPAARTSLAAAPDAGQVTLTWDPYAADPARDRATTFRVLVDGAPVATLGDASATSSTVTGLVDGRSSTFAVVAVDASGRAGPPATVVAAAGDVTPPSVPGGVAATRGDAAATLSWTAVAELDVARYEVLGADGAVVATITAPTTSATVAPLVNGVPATFRVRAVDTAGNVSALSSPVGVVPLAPPVAIAGLGLTMSGDDALLSWAAPAVPAPGGHEAAAGVVVRRVGVDGGGDRALSTDPLPPGTTAYRVTGLAPGEAASFYLVAVDADPRESPRSVVVSTRLPAPTGVGASPGDSSATVSWAAVPGAGGYRVERSPDADGGPWTTATGTPSGTGLTVTGLTDGTAYRFRVVALPASGQESVPSLEVAVTVGRAPAPVSTPGGGSASSGVAVTRDERYALLETRTSSSDARPALVLADLSTGTRTTIAQQPSGPGGDQTFKDGTRIAAVALSEDGRYAAVATTAAIDAVRDRNGAMDVYRYATATGAWTLVSAPRGASTGSTTAGVLGQASTTDPTLRPQVAVSRAGDVFFTSQRTDLVTGVDGLNVFVQRVDGSVALASDPTWRPKAAGGGPATFVAERDGAWVAYVTGARRPGDDLVRHAVGAAGTVSTLLSDGAAVNHRSGQIAVSDDGSRAVYSTGTGTAGVRLATLDPSTGTLSATTVGSSARSLAQVGIAPDGSAVFFATTEQLVQPDDKGSVDVFRVLADGSGLKRVTPRAPGPPVDSVGVASYGPVRPLAGDRVLVVTPQALIAGDTNGASDAYVVTASTGRAYPLVPAAP